MTDWLTVEGFCEEAKPTLVFALFTVCGSVGLVLPPKFGSLAYLATMLCGDPTAVSPASGQVAVAIPLEFVAEGVTAAQPVMDAPLSVNATVPVRPELPTGLSVIVAVKVTAGDWFTVEVGDDEERASVVPAEPTVSVTLLLVLPLKFASLA
jgi:hypothetical protein